MRRFIPFVLAAAIAVPSLCVSAANEEATVRAQRSGNEISIESAAENGTAVLNCYTDGKLVYSTHDEPEGEKYTFTLPQEYIDTNMRVSYIASQKTYAVEVTDAAATAEPSESAVPSASAAPSATTAPEASAEPTQTASATPTKTPFPSIYPKEIDAVNAPAVVKSIEETVVDGETHYTAVLLYQGNEITTDIRDSVEISKAPSDYSSVAGNNASALAEGDVIYFTCDLQGRVKTLILVYRPSTDDYILDRDDIGSSFQNIFTPANGTTAVYGSKNNAYTVYAFGAPVKKNKSTLLLANASGKTMEIDTEDGTIVYNVEVGSRGYNCELAGTGIGSIYVNFIEKNNFDDDDDNVISWDDTDELAYALVRIVDGTATDVIVFNR